MYIDKDKESILCKGEFASASPSIQSTNGRVWVNFIYLRNGYLFGNHA